ncbi:MAG: glycosyltransferase family 2 protein [Verrucomicrobiota bacterium]
MKKAVIIPSYKAADTLPSVIDRLPDDFAKGGGQAFIINDCSPDNTGSVADELAAKFKHVTALHHETNQGYGGALKTGLRHALDNGYEIMIVVHADGQYAPEMALKLAEPIERGDTEIVQGSRMIGGGAREGGMPLTRYLPNRALTCLENLVVGTHMDEFHSGYMVFSAKLLESVPFEKLQNNYNFDAEMIIMAHLCGIRCAEIPIPTRYDDETSSLNPIPYGLNVLKMMWRHTLGDYRLLLDEHQTAQAAAPAAS